MSKEAKPLTEKQAQARAIKEAKALALAKAIEAASAVLVPPKALSTAGIVKTRCWIVIHNKLSRQIKLRRPDIEVVKKLTVAMITWADLSFEQAHALGSGIKGSNL